MQCTPVPPLTESARSDAAISCTFDFFESACCATAVDVSRPSGGSCGGAVCSALCEDHCFKSEWLLDSQCGLCSGGRCEQGAAGWLRRSPHLTNGGREDRCCDSGEVTVAKSACSSSKPILCGGGPGLGHDAEVWNYTTQLAPC